MKQPNKMDWSDLISSQRLGQNKEVHELDEYRTDFQRDFDRLIFSSPFRRLQNKTQVFPLPGSIFVHNRLTHSLEVSSVGRSLGHDAAQSLIKRHPELANSDISMLDIIVSTACLAHDLGNPPFGHAGERAISSYFSEGDGLRVKKIISQECNSDLAEIVWNDIVHFDGNANAFRLLTHQYEGRRKGGYVMTFSTLASIVKYPYTSILAGKNSKFGFFHTELPYFQKIADKLGLICLECNNYKVKYARHPLAYFVEAADDICYEIMDIEDAHKLHILTTTQTEELFLNFFDKELGKKISTAHPDVMDTNEHIIYLRACVINAIEQECVRVFLNHEDEILSGNFHGSLIQNMSEKYRIAFENCVKIAKELIYRDRKVLDVELAGYRIIYELLDLMTDAILSPDKAYSQQLINRVPNQYKVNAPTVRERIQGVLDFISGMTDVYALDLYRKINGQSLPSV